jgi:hypothetical protein
MSKPLSLYILIPWVVQRFLATTELQDPFYAGGKTGKRHGAILAEHDILFTQLERSGFSDGQGQSV